MRRICGAVVVAWALLVSLVLRDPSVVAQAAESGLNVTSQAGARQQLTPTIGLEPANG